MYDHLFKMIILNQNYSLSKDIDWLITENEPSQVRKAFGIDNQFLTLHTEEFDVRLHIWQFEGNINSFNEIRTDFYKVSKGCILIFDMEEITESCRFIRLKIDEMKESIGKIPILFIGQYTNQKDKDEHVINNTKIKELLGDWEFIYMETDSKSISEFRNGLYKLIRIMIANC